MTRVWVRLTKAFLALSLGITLAKLSTDRGGGQYLLTLIGYVVATTIAPYWLSLKAMPRLTARWADAVGIGACVFGVIDVVLRIRGFFFPTESLNGGLAFWLPISSLVAIPFAAVIAHTFITAAAGQPQK